MSTSFMQQDKVTIFDYIKKIEDIAGIWYIVDNDSLE